VNLPVRPVNLPVRPVNFKTLVSLLSHFKNNNSFHQSTAIWKQ
jgi:hypothetical protein